MRHLTLLFILLFLTGCGGSNQSSTPPAPQIISPDPPATKLETFGYAAITCDLDDPFDQSDKTDMADVAQNYFDYAKARQDIAAIFVYTWAGGIDGPDEKGVRDLPQIVQDKHKTIGREITGR